jgi:hypothetical protein
MRAYATTVNGATATLLVDADNVNRTVYVHVVGNQAVALGGASVTFATGLLTEKHTAPVAFFVPLGEKIYGICNTDQTEVVRILAPDQD